MSKEFNIKDVILDEIERHPYLQPEDLVKLSFQAAYGCEHLLTDTESARNYLRREWEQADNDEPLFQLLSPSFARVHIAACVRENIPENYIFEVFERSTLVKEENADELFNSYIATITEIELPFPKEEWLAFLKQYEENGGGAIHHSRIYHDTAKPMYRVIYIPYFNTI